MKLAVFTIRLDPETGVFDDGALRVFLEDKDVISVHEHFVDHPAAPLWAVLVGWRPDGDAAARPARTAQRWRAELDPAEKSLFDALRDWRNERSAAEGKPPFVLLTNRQAADIARRRPMSLTELREIAGIGEAKATAYGEALLGLVAAATEAGAPPPEPAR